MRTHTTRLLTVTFAAASLTACAVIPEPVEPVEPVAPPVVVEVPPAPTCFEVSALQRVEIPDPETGNQKEVTNLCDPAVVVGPVGPAPGEAVSSPTTG